MRYLNRELTEDEKLDRLIDSLDDPLPASGSFGSPHGVSRVINAKAPNPIPKLTTPYAFPVDIDRRYSRHENSELPEFLAMLLVKAFSPKTGTGYSSIRDKYCAINLEMNYRQLQAPRFRPLNQWDRDFSTPDKILESLDRQVIDLHWRAHSTDKPISEANGYPAIFDGERFNFEMAGRFAQEEWKPSAKVTHLHLTERMEMEHAILVRSELKKRMRVIFNGDVRGALVKQRGAPQIEIAIRESMIARGHPEHVSHIPGLLNVWKARELVGPKPKEISKLIASMTGQPPRDPSSIRRNLKTLDQHLGTPRSNVKKSEKDAD